MSCEHILTHEGGACPLKAAPSDRRRELYPSRVHRAADNVQAAHGIRRNALTCENTSV